MRGGKRAGAGAPPGSRNRAIDGPPRLVINVSLSKANTARLEAAWQISGASRVYSSPDEWARYLCRNALLKTIDQYDPGEGDNEDTEVKFD